MAADFQSYFNEFVRRLFLDETRVERIESALRHLEDVVSNDVRMRRYRPRLFRQGSYACGLAIKPVRANDEYDVDVVLELNLPRSTTSNQALDWLDGRLAEDVVFRSRLVDHDRCVRIDYAGDFHLDVVPARRVWSQGGAFQGRIWVPNRAGRWKLSYPRGFLRWCQAQDKRTGGDFGRAVWMLKRWRDLRSPEKRRVRSIVFTILVGKCVPSWRRVGTSTLPDAALICATLDRLDRYLRSRYGVPVVRNPSLTNENLARDWTHTSFEAFRDEVTAAKRRAERARAGTDASAWQHLFGDAFPTTL